MKLQSPQPAYASRSAAIGVSANTSRPVRAPIMTAINVITPAISSAGTAEATKVPSKT